MSFLNETKSTSTRGFARFGAWLSSANRGAARRTSTRASKANMLERDTMRMATMLALTLGGDR